MSLKYVAAYSLVSLTNAKPSKEEVSNVVKAAGGTVDAAELDFVFAQIGTKTSAQLIADGTAKMSVCGGGGAAAPAKAAAAAEPAAKAAPAKKVEEKVEEEDDFGMGGLF